MRTGKLCFIGGLLLIAAALCLTAYNLWDANRAAESAEAIARELEELAAPKAPTPGVTEAPAPVETGPTEETAAPAYVLDPAMEMPTVEVDGNEYIGILEIPALGLSLPVMSGWSYPKLKLAPCRFSGSAYLNDLIIAGHNYSSHFGKLKDLSVSDEVVFTDAAGNVFSYTVFVVEQVGADDAEGLESGSWDLTLFTCTVGGKARVTVRCARIDETEIQK